MLMGPTKEIANEKGKMIFFIRQALNFSVWSLKYNYGKMLWNKQEGLKKKLLLLFLHLFPRSSMK